MKRTALLFLLPWAIAVSTQTKSNGKDHVRHVSNGRSVLNCDSDKSSEYCKELADRLTRHQGRQKVRGAVNPRSRVPPPECLKDAACFQEWEDIEKKSQQ